MASSCGELPGEAKHRRAAPAASLAPDVIGAAGAAAGAGADVEAGTTHTGAGADAAQKRRRTLLGSFRALFLSAVRSARRRRTDVLAGGGLLLFIVVGYAYAVTELLPPNGTFPAQVLSALGHGVFALFVAHGLGVMLHGPGRVPDKKRGAGWQPAPLVEAALEAGRFAQYRPFRGTEEWCFECNHWKPPLAHHCSVCNRCSLWMDHHCNVLGQCVGFRNLRCFVCFGASAQLLVVFLLILSLLRLVLDFATVNRWILGRILLFDGCLAYGLKASRSHFRFILLKISMGWPSGVLLTKFTGLAETAQQIVHAFGGMPSSSMKELQAASERVLWPSGGLRGLFAAEGLLPSLEVVFGEPPSWRWLLPLRPGGRGDPLRPVECCEDSCRAWAALGAAMEGHFEVMAQVQRLMAMREQAAAQVAEQWTAQLEPSSTRARSAEDAFSA